MNIYCFFCENQVITWSTWGFLILLVFNFRLLSNFGVANMIGSWLSTVDHDDVLQSQNNSNTWSTFRKQWNKLPFGDVFPAQISTDKLGSIVKTLAYIPECSTNKNATKNHITLVRFFLSLITTNSKEGLKCSWPAICWKMRPLLTKSPGSMIFKNKWPYITWILIIKVWT